MPAAAARRCPATASGAPRCGSWCWPPARRRPRRSPGGKAPTAGSWPRGLSPCGSARPGSGCAVPPAVGSCRCAGCWPSGQTTRPSRSRCSYALSSRGCDHFAVDLSGDVALEAADDLVLGLAFLGATLHVGLGALVTAHTAHGDHPQGIVGLAVAAAVGSLGRLGCQVAWLTVPPGVVRLAWGRPPRVQLRAVTCLAP